MQTMILALSGWLVAAIVGYRYWLCYAAWKRADASLRICHAEAIHLRTIFTEMNAELQKIKRFINERGPAPMGQGTLLTDAAGALAPLSVRLECPVSGRDEAEAQVAAMMDPFLTRQ